MVGSGVFEPEDAIMGTTRDRLAAVSVAVPVVMVETKNRQDVSCHLAFRHSDTQSVKSKERREEGRSL